MLIALIFVRCVLAQKMCIRNIFVLLTKNQINNLIILKQYPESAASVPYLSPDEFSAQPHSTSELLRFL